MSREPFGTRHVLDTSPLPRYPEFNLVGHFINTVSCSWRTAPYGRGSEAAPHGAATTGAVGALIGEQGWSLAAAVIAASGLLLAAALWWAYYLIPSRTLLEEWPDRTMPWRYAHLPMFGALAAVGAGLGVATMAVEHGDVTVLSVALALAVPVALVIVMIFVMWSLLVHSTDLGSHLPLLTVALVPLAAAVVVGVLAGAGNTMDAEDATDTTALVAVIALVALSAVIEVVGHERVSYAHTLRAVERAAGD